jgi:ribosomal protein S18 acetylase RimI-like enzyme
MPASDPGYGFVRADVPEVTVALMPPYRGQGIGTALLRQLLADAGAAGYPALSLSVQAQNPARRLYERLRFVRVPSLVADEEAWTMWCVLGAGDGCG